MSVGAPISWLTILLLVWLPLPTSSQCNNQYGEDTGSDGEDIWRSLPSSCFTPRQSVAYGTIKLGREMQMTFDFTWNNYTFDPHGQPYDDYEEFFRVGCSVFEDVTPFSPCSGGDGCAGLGARYPQFSVTPPLHPNGSDFGPPKMHLSLSSSGDCKPNMELTEWGELEMGVKLHIDIFWNATTVIAGIGHYSNYIQDPTTFPEKSIKFQRTADTNERYIGWDMPVWFMSDIHEDVLINRGDAIIENIQIISKYFADTTTAAPGPDSTTDTNTDTTTEEPDDGFYFELPMWQITMIIVFLTTVFLIVSVCLGICWWQNRQFKKKINSPEFRRQVEEELKRRRAARRAQMEAESGGAIATGGGPDTKDADRKSLLDDDGNVLQQQDNEMEMVQLADKEDGVETLNTDIVEEESS